MSRPCGVTPSLLLRRCAPSSVPAWNIQHAPNYGSVDARQRPAGRCGPHARRGGFVAMATTVARRLPRPLSLGIWVVVVVLGTFALAAIAFSRGESINAMWFIVAAVCI